MLLDALRSFCLQYGISRTYWVAYSGGLDSHVLLSLCNELRQDLDIKLRIIHINHGFSPNAEQWAIHCGNMCQEYGLDLVIHPLNLKLNRGDSLEAEARTARYAVFADYLNQEDMLLTAHHQDDQAETVLLQLLRGSGPKGLSAMPAIKPFACGFHGRPLLQFPRTMLQDYAHQQRLNWIDDESNNNLNLSRNFIRHEVMPVLKTRWPTATATIARSAANCAEVQGLLEEFGAEISASVCGSRPDTVSVNKLLQLSPERQRLILRCWIQQCGFPLPDAKKIAAIQRDVFTAAWDRMPCVEWNNVELRRYRDDLFLLQSAREQNLQPSYEWNLSTSLEIPGLGILKAIPVKGRGLRSNLQKVSVQFRQGGESIELAGRGRRTLKNLLQEWNVLPWERDRIPLIFDTQKLVAAVDYFIDANYSAQENESGWEILLEKNT